jgi:hypothetical protein
MRHPDRAIMARSSGAGGPITADRPADDCLRANESTCFRMRDLRACRDKYATSDPGHAGIHRPSPAHISAVWHRLRLSAPSSGGPGPGPPADPPSNHSRGGVLTVDGELPGDRDGATLSPPPGPGRPISGSGNTVCPVPRRSRLESCPPVRPVPCSGPDRAPRPLLVTQLALPVGDRSPCRNVDPGPGRSTIQ